MTDDFDRPLWRRLVLNRFVVVLGAIALAIVGWNAFVASYSGGHVAGRVTDAAGEPYIAAEKAGVGRSRRVPVRLYFRAQDVELREPLVLVPTSQGGS